MRSLFAVCHLSVIHGFGFFSLLATFLLIHGVPSKVEIIFSNTSTFSYYTVHSFLEEKSSQISCSLRNMKFSPKALCFFKDLNSRGQRTSRKKKTPDVLKPFEFVRVEDSRFWRTMNSERKGNIRLVGIIGQCTYSMLLPYFEHCEALKIQVPSLPHETRPLGD